MKRLNIFLLLILPLSVQLFGKVDGTTGLPLGGIGTGAVKFNATAGTFAASFNTPTRNGDYQPLTDTQFQIFTLRNTAIVTSQKMVAFQNNGRVDDDAVFPVHFVNFGNWNDVTVTLTAYLPFDPQSVQVMSHPCAMFEFTFTNLQNTAVSAAVAFQLNTPAVPVAISDSGWVANTSSRQLCLLGSFVGGSGDMTYGNDAGFFSNGLCNNQLSGTTNRLALRVSLNPAETRNVRFVLSWYRPDELDHFYYTNYWNNAKAVAVSAMNNFDNFKENGQELVNRMRASNLPAWLIDQTLNSLVNLVNNSVYFQDGRYCHTEGQWTPEGTMDQMWQSRQIYTMINPDLAWQELEWWARTQHVQNYSGQIHHDFGESFNYVGWDATEHADYRSIYEWVDLNCGLIISVYEAFIATADQDKLSYFWPYVKKAAQRILDQVDSYGDTQYPYTFSSSLSTYDAGGNSQAYNTGLSIAVYQLMIYLSQIMGEQDTETVYQDAWQNAVSGFENRWLNSAYPLANYCESVLGGPWIANFLKIDSFWPKEKLDNLYLSITNYYDPLNMGMGLLGGSYSEWQPYLIGHLGGYSLQINRPDIWFALQKDMYERNYNDRNLVFNQQLGIPAKVNIPHWIATSNSGYNQYISIPMIWRNYYTMIGYHRNEYSDELWLEPVLFDSLQHQLQQALLFTPDGYATLSCQMYGDQYQNQEITFQTDSPLEVSALYVRDLYADSVNSIQLVKVNGIDTDFLRTGNGDQTHLELNWSGIISGGGLEIQIEGIAKQSIVIPSAPEGLQASVVSPSRIDLCWNRSAVGEINGYIIETKMGSTFKTLYRTTSVDTFFQDTGLRPSTTYTYRVKSYNALNTSQPSIEIEASTAGGGTGEVVAALNAGGSTFNSTSGIQYVGDASSGWVSGGAAYSTTDTIAGTVDDILYQSERYGNFNYAIPLANGSYDLVLKFAEIYWDSPKGRLFDVQVEGERVIQNLDIFFRCGNDRAYDVVIPVNLGDASLNIGFITITDNAKLSALEIRHSDGTGFNNFILDHIPAHYFLAQNYPNPFNPLTHFQFGLPKAAVVRLVIYNITGEQVAVLIAEKKAAGIYSINFNAGSLASGIYFYCLQAGEFKSVKKMILLR